MNPDREPLPLEATNEVWLKCQQPAAEILNDANLLQAAAHEGDHGWALAAVDRIIATALALRDELHGGPDRAA